jgi:gamma-glutamyltranspeptidase/glutathione hydrolase
MVSAPESWSAHVGANVLERGGSAVDAAIAVSAALCASMPHQLALGGDAFWLIRTPHGATQVLDATGPFPGAGTPEVIQQSGLRELAPRHAASVTVPGMVDGWLEAHQRYGKLPLDELLEPAARGAESGRPVTPLYLRHLIQVAGALHDPEFRRVFVPNGQMPRVGERLVQRDLAATLRQLAKDPRQMYEGQLAEQLAIAVQDEGGFLSVDDLAGYRATWREPVTREQLGWELSEVPAPSQGSLAHLGLAIRDRFRHDRDALTSLHLWLEAAKVMMLVRDAVLGDPASMTEPVDHWLSDRFVDSAAALIRQDRALRRGEIQGLLAKNGLSVPYSRPAGDTCHIAVVDSDGLAASCVASVFWDFGVGLVPARTGVLLHNRAVGQFLDGDHPNRARPGRRPMHTLAPGMAAEDGQTAAVFGCMGGHAQAQLHLQMLQGLLIEGRGPAHTIARPRWYVDVTAREPVVHLEEGLGGAEELRRLGHEVVAEPYGKDIFGHEQIIVVDPQSGTLIGAADPRSGGQTIAT